jgi:nitrogen-specific signal transduction histidine kinase
MRHEIRSPLTAIIGYADILLTRLEDPEDIECLRTIKESGDYLIEIINDILDLAKIEAGKLVLNFEPVSIHALLAEVQSLMNGRAKQKDLSLVLRYDGLLPENVETDRTRLRQILLNLEQRDQVHRTRQDRNRSEIFRGEPARNRRGRYGYRHRARASEDLVSALYSGRYDEHAAVRGHRPGASHYPAAG